MAYDTYSPTQPDYYQDPYQDSGYGYDEYGYDQQPYTQPPPDKNWVDPLRVNREYLKKIQRSCVHKGFEGLKEDGLFLFEVLVRAVSLRKDIFESLASPEGSDKPFMTFVKFLDTHFVEVNEAEKASNGRSSGEYRTTSVLANRKSFTNLFQSIYTTTGDHESLIPGVEDNTVGGVTEDRPEIKNKDGASESAQKENTSTEDNETNVEEVEQTEIMKGRSVLLPMPGLCMIQKMQQYPLILKVARQDVVDDDVNVEGETIATSFVRLPETFRKAVLVSCRPDAILPVVVVTTDRHKLIDPEGWEVGDAELTLVVTCFGKGAVNCVSEAQDAHDYDHTFLLRHLKTKHEVADGGPQVDPRLAKEIVKLGLFFPGRKTSSEILQHCVSSNLIPSDVEEKKHAQKRECGWFHMLKKALPSSTHSIDFDKYIKEMDKEIAALWRKHKKICRDLKTEEPVSRTSLEDRFREVQIVQTGVIGIDTQHPFEELARKSSSGQCLKSFASN